MTETTHFSKQVRDFLHLHGSRATLTRLKIFKELIHYHSAYFEVEDISRNLQQRNELMATSTVYKTLQQLCLMGLLMNERTTRGAALYKKTDLFKQFQSEHPPLG